MRYEKNYVFLSKKIYSLIMMNLIKVNMKVKKKKKNLVKNINLWKLKKMMVLKKMMKKKIWKKVWKVKLNMKKVNMKKKVEKKMKKNRKKKLEENQLGKLFVVKTVNSMKKFLRKSRMTRKTRILRMMCHR